MKPYQKPAKELARNLVTMLQIGLYGVDDTNAQTIFNMKDLSGLLPFTKNIVKNFRPDLMEEFLKIQALYILRKKWRRVRNTNTPESTQIKTILQHNKVILL